MPYIYVNAIFMNDKIKIYNGYDSNFIKRTGVQPLMIIYDTTDLLNIDDEKIVINKNRKFRTRLYTLESAVNRITRCENIKCTKYGICRRHAFITRVTELCNKLSTSNLRIVLAGGCMQNMFIKLKKRKCKCKSDIDLFIIGKSNIHQLNLLIIYICNLYEIHFGNYILINTSNSFSICPIDSSTTVQIIKKCYDSIEHLLDTFDLDASCYAFDGVHVWTNERGQLSYMTGMNSIDLSRQSLSYEYRLCKYHKKYGVGIYDTMYDPSRVNRNVICGDNTTSGLATVIRYSIKCSLSDIRTCEYSSGIQIKNVENIKVINKIQKLLDNTFSHSKYRSPIQISFDAFYMLTRSYSDSHTGVDDYPPNFFDWSNSNTTKSFYPCNREWYLQAYGAHVIHEDKIYNAHFSKMLSSYNKAEKIDRRWVLRIDLNDDLSIFLNSDRLIRKNKLLINKICTLKNND
jgi:hypothetical protein